MNAVVAKALLQAADLFYDKDEDMPDGDSILNMNDVWGWATAWGEKVPETEWSMLGDLFYKYGWCGVLYWVSERHEQMRSEFEDVNRMVEFVRAEEGIIRDFPNSSKRAYAVRKYTLGGPA